MEEKLKRYFELHHGISLSDDNIRKIIDIVRSEDIRGPVKWNNSYYSIMDVLMYKLFNLFRNKKPIVNLDKYSDIEEKFS
jgi:hypothetical protein